MSRRAAWRVRLYRVVTHTDTAAGKWFYGLVLGSILLSVAVVMLDSVRAIHERYGGPLYVAEWFFTLWFTAEYVVRLLAAPRPSRYASSFYGVVYLLAILPTYMSVFLLGAQHLLIIRVLRLLRIFRIFKMGHFVSEGAIVMRALKASRRKVTVFVLAVMTLVVIFGALMYLIEGEEHGFTSIPRAVYWAIVTLTTVGYGDIAPGTVLGQFLAALIMLTGYGIIAVPTGIVTAELARSLAPRPPHPQRACPDCPAADHAQEASYCNRCGARLPPRAAS